METRKLASIVVSCCNALIQVLTETVEMVEKELAKDKDDNGKSEKEKSGERSSSSSRRKEATSRLDAKNKEKEKAKDDDEDDDDEDEDDEKKDDGDEPSLEDLQDAVRAALKVCENVDVVKCLKKHGKAKKASEVEPDMRGAAIKGLEKLVDEA